MTGLTPLGILAGGGSLPRLVIEAAQSQGRPVAVIAFDGQTDPETVHEVPHLWAGLGSAGPIVDWLKARGVVDLVMGGRIRRPSWHEIRPDWRAALFLAKVGARALGDDGLLRAITHALEDEGFRVVAVQDLIDRVLAPTGPVGHLGPDEAAEADIARGVAVARALGVVDVGQAVVVQQGLVLGVEAVEGTDALIDRCRDLHRDGPGGVLVKMRKPQQDHRFDLPTIGPATVTSAAAAGLRGIAVEAGGSLMLDRAGLAAAADAAGLFVVGVDAAVTEADAGEAAS